MGPAEVKQRLYRAVRRRHGLGRGTSFGEQDADDALESLLRASSLGLKERISSRFDASFFFGPEQHVALSSQIRQRFPSNARRLADLAEAVCKGGIAVLGRVTCLVPGKIDWQADPVSQRRCWPVGPMDEADATGVVGADVKYVWEVNRHQFLVTLGRAFWVTQEPRYARQAVALIDDWIAKNPVGCGVNWCSHLEVAMRAISWLWAMPFLLAWQDLDEVFLRRWLASLGRHHDHLAHNLSVFTDPTNHLIGEAFALWMLSICLPYLPRAQEREELATRILVREVERQVAADGVNREQATSYHRFVLDFYLQLCILAHRNGRSLPAIVNQRLEAMLEFAAALAGSYGNAPMIGDSDDARGIPLQELTGWDFRDLLSTGALLLGRGDWKRLAGEMSEASLWLLGPKASDRYTSMPVDAASSLSKVFSSGGYCFLRSAAVNTDAELLFDVGSLGLLPNAAHGHADALSVIVRIKGRYLLTDPGTGTYFTDAAVRNAFRQTCAHNTVTVDRIDQADIFDTFKWVNPTRTRLLNTFVGDDFDYAEAMHDGYRRLRSPVDHYRAALNIKPWGWIIVDRLAGGGEHAIARHFTVPPDARLLSDSSDSCSVVDEVSGYGVRLAFPGTEQSSAQLRHEPVLWSPRYGHWERTRRVELYSYTRTPVIFLTFITPIEPSQDCAPAATDSSRYHLEHITNGKGVLCTRRTSAGLTDLLVVNPQGANLVLADGCTTDARLLFVRSTPEGTVERAFLAGAEKSVRLGSFELRTTSATQYGSFVHAR
jgi:hypothetical protein